MSSPDAFRCLVWISEPTETFVLCIIKMSGFYVRNVDQTACLWSRCLCDELGWWIYIHSITRMTSIYLPPTVAVTWRHVIVGRVRKTCETATINFVTSACPSVCPQGTARLQLHRLPWNLISDDFSKIFRENLNSHYSMRRITGTLHEDQCTVHLWQYVGWILLRMTNIWDQICRENPSSINVWQE
jgi:hypothetical protein